jgi:hypothetical protein
MCGRNDCLFKVFDAFGPNSEAVYQRTVIKVGYALQL